MLTKEEKVYLKKIDPKKLVSIYPFDQKGKLLGESIVKKIKKHLPELEVLFMGSVTLEVAGQKDIDIYVLADPKHFDKYLPSLKKLFGGFAKQGKYVNKTFVEWKYKESGYEIEVYLTEPPRRQIRVFEILKSNKKFLKEYKDLKLSFDGKSYKEYQKAKYEFYDRILNSNEVLKKRKVIKSTLIWRGKEYQLKYVDTDSFDSLPYEKCQQVYGVCFFGERMVVVKGESGVDGKGWGLVGGHIENGETFEETLVREVQEETNMKVLKSAPVGYQKVTSAKGNIVYQLRYCAIVNPIGKFEKDPAGSVEEIKLINPKDYKKYFDWGDIGERIIQRALYIKESNLFN